MLSYPGTLYLPSSALGAPDNLCTLACIQYHQLHHCYSHFSLLSYHSVLPHACNLNMYLWFWTIGELFPYSYQYPRPSWKLSPVRFSKRYQPQPSWNNNCANYFSSPELYYFILSQLGRFLASMPVIGTWSARISITYYLIREGNIGEKLLS
jgi:hypothetical protein